MKNTKFVEVFQKLMQLLARQQKIKTLGITALGMVLALMETTTIALMTPFVTAMTAPDTVWDTSWGQFTVRYFHCETTADIMALIATALVCMYIVKGLFGLFVRWVQQHFYAYSRSRLSATLFDCLMHKPYSYHLQHSTAELQRMVTGDVNSVYSLLSVYITLATQMLSAVSILAYLLVLNAGLTLAAIALLAFILLISNKVIRKTMIHAGENELRHKTEMFKWVNQGAGGLKGILVNRRQQLFVNQYSGHADGVANIVSQCNLLNGVTPVFMETSLMGGIFALLAVLAKNGINMTALLPTLATFAVAAMKLLPMANTVSATNNQINYTKPVFDAVYTVLMDSGIDMEKAYHKPIINPERPLLVTPPLSEGVLVDHVRFGFADAKKPLYEDITLKIPAKRSVAFVGYTGSGKTTLADIILGLHAPQAGRILVDGHDIHQEPDWWADRVGYIPQFIYLCDDTIRANVAFGCNPADVTDEKVWHCLEEAQMKEFVQSLPEGLDTKTGENGVRLSGGQRQRIGIARALYTDPQFLVMDEATSALDNDTERAIIDSINHLSGQKTLLIIAHRLTTIKDCHIVYRIENGMAKVERGEEYLP